MSQYGTNCYNLAHIEHALPQMSMAEIVIVEVHQCGMLLSVITPA